MFRKNLNFTHLDIKDFIDNNNGSIFSKRDKFKIEWLYEYLPNIIDIEILSDYYHCIIFCILQDEYTNINYFLNNMYYIEQYLTFDINNDVNKLTNISMKYIYKEMVGEDLWQQTLKL